MDQHRYDICIIGCGPAGLAAAINAKNKNRDIILLGSDLCSPPLHKAPHIANYLGLPAIKGDELRLKFIDHATAMGVEIVKSKADNVFPDEEGFMVMHGGGEMLSAKTVIIATGVPYRPTLKNEADFLGRGLGYCATCDGPLYEGKVVGVIGYTPETEPEVNYLAEICSKVLYFPLYKEPPKVDPRAEIVHERPGEVRGDTVVRMIVAGKQEYTVDGVFIIGSETAPDRLVPGLELEEDGIHIKVNRKMETSIEGIYAAGDCTGQPYQLSKSTGEGQVAALNAAKQLLRAKA
ncbi:MAG: NAD(P)/FAD-dependent oxidoreductase [Solirubrobacterales bacterium]